MQPTAFLLFQRNWSFCSVEHADKHGTEPSGVSNYGTSMIEQGLKGFEPETLWVLACTPTKTASRE